MIRKAVGHSDQEEKSVQCNGENDDIADHDTEKLDENLLILII